MIAERATTIRIHSGAPPTMWPWLIAYAVDWHNATIGSAGSSTADVYSTPHMRLTHRPPQVMDLPAFGCQAVVLKPPTHQHKPSLQGRGWVGIFIGRSRNSKGAYDVLVDGMIVTSSSVLVNEEYFSWLPEGQRKRPLTSVKHSAHAPSQDTLAPPSATTAGSVVSAPATFSDVSKLKMCNLFSGPYDRADGLESALKDLGWFSTSNVDNDGERGGGWAADLLNDSKYASLLSEAKSGQWDALTIAFPCSTAAISRFFNAAAGDNDSGPPVLRTAEYPDGLPLDQIDPKYHRELEMSNLLLKRTVDIAIAARNSPRRTTIFFENPVDRSDRNFIGFSEKLSNHGSIFSTTEFKRLLAAIDLEKATFAYCRMNQSYQKYTTFYYSPEAAPVLDVLKSPDFQCNHPRGTHTEKAGGRDNDGEFVSGKASRWPNMVVNLVARGATLARTGSDEPIVTHTKPANVPDQLAEPTVASAANDESASATGTAATPLRQTLPTQQTAPAWSSTAPPDAIPFPDLSPRASAPPALTSGTGKPESPKWKLPGVGSSPLAPRRADSKVAASQRAPVAPQSLSPISESASFLEESAALLAFDAEYGGEDLGVDDQVIPLTPWLALDDAAGLAALSSQDYQTERLPDGSTALVIEVVLDDSTVTTEHAALLASVCRDSTQHALQSLALVDDWKGAARGKRRRRGRVAPHR